MASIGRAQNIGDLARIARKKLPEGLYEYIDRGAEDEITLRENRDSIKRVLLRQRVDVDVSQRDISTELFGAKLAMPVGIAATGMAALLSFDGERRLARAAARAGIPYTIGTSNFTAQADLKEICGDLLWRLLYPPADRTLVDHHVGMSRELGIKVLQVTMDSPVVGNREYMARNGFVPHQTNWRTFRQVLGSPHWLFGTLLPYLMSGGFPEIADMPEGQRKFWGGTFSWANTAQDWTWDDMRQLRRKWDGVLIAKGLSTAEDARLAADCGVDGIIVSNHGGRSLDGCVPSFGALPEIVDAVAPRLKVIVDGGFTRGADVLKAIAMGASGVMVGRATLFGLVAGGEPGVDRAIAILRQEIDRALALIGCRNVSELNRSHLLLNQPGWPQFA